MLLLSFTKEEALSAGISDSGPTSALALLSLANPQIQTLRDICDPHRNPNELLSCPSLLNALELQEPKVLFLVDIALALTPPQTLKGSSRLPRSTEPRDESFGNNSQAERQVPFTLQQRNTTLTSAEALVKKHQSEWLNASPEDGPIIMRDAGRFKCWMGL